MKALTLTEFIKHELETDPEFAECYARTQIIHDISIMIYNARKAAKVTQTKLAKKVGTTQSVVSRIESGTTKYIPSLETLAKIAKALNMHLQLSMQAA